jgi:hypothetical protein
MPSKSAHLIAFLTIFLVSAGSHRFVYVHLRELIRKDFRRRSTELVRLAAGVFVLMDLPFLYLFLSKWISAGHDQITRALLYPFSLWQALMLFWTAILLVRFFLRRSAYAGVSLVRYIRAERMPSATESLEAEPTL